MFTGMVRVSALFTLNVAFAVATGVPEEFAPVTAAPDGAQQGGELLVLNEGDIDYMDPGAAYYQVTYSLTLATQRTLMGWPPNATQPAPDLADGQPQVTDGGKTITFKIRPGVHYSPPVDRAVTSQDVKYAIERTLLPGVPNGYTAAYLDGVVGFKAAEDQVKADKTTAPNISGTSVKIAVPPLSTSRSAKRPSSGLAVIPDKPSLPPHLSPTTRSCADSALLRSPFARSASSPNRVIPSSCSSSDACAERKRRRVSSAPARKGRNASK